MADTLAIIGTLLAVATMCYGMLVWHDRRGDRQ